MPIIYSYPKVTTLSTQDLFVISKVNTSTGVIENKSVEADDLASYVTNRVNLNFEGDTGTAVVNLDTQSLSIEGTANEIETVAVQGNSRGILTIGLPDSVTITNNLTVSNNLLVSNDASIAADLGVQGEIETSTLQVNSTAFVGGVLSIEDNINMTQNGRIINLENPINSQDAATKFYVDTAVTGLLEFKGTFRADTGEILSGGSAGAFIYNCPGGAGTRIDVEVGDYYIVANTGGQFYCSGDVLQVGDSIVGVANATGNTSTINDWGVLEGNNVEGTGLTNAVPLWTDSQVLGNSNISQDLQGTVIINANTTINDELTMGNAILMDGNIIDELPTPTSNTEATNKSYVDGLTTTNANNITTNADDIADLQTDVSTNITNISNNTNAITGKVDRAGDTMTGDLTILKTTNNPVLAVKSEESVGGNFQTAIINLRAKETISNTETVGQFQVHGPNSINTGGAGNVVIQNQTVAGGQVVIASRSGGGNTNWNRFKENGQVQFEEYGSGTLTGTAAYNISVDASGNLIETPNPTSGGAWTTLEVNLSGNVLANTFNGNLSDAITLVTVPANHFAKILEVTGVIYAATTGTTDYNANNSLYVKRAGSTTGGSFSAPEIMGSFINSSGDRMTNSNGQPVAAQTNNLSSYGGLGTDIVLGPSTTGPVTITQGDRTIKLSITYRLIDFTP